MGGVSYRTYPDAISSSSEGFASAGRNANGAYMVYMPMRAGMCMGIWKKPEGATNGLPIPWVDFSHSVCSLERKLVR